MSLPPGATLVSGTMPLPPGATLVTPTSGPAQGTAYGPPGTTPGSGHIEGISATPQPTGIRDRLARWAENVSNDIKFGSDTTGVGTLIKKMGAHGVYNGNSEDMADFMASLPLGMARATKGGAEITQSGKTWQGTKDIAGGALQAYTIPGLMASGPAAEAAVEAIPSAEGAGNAFNEISAAIGKHTVAMTNDLSDATQEVSRLAKSGGQMPKVVGDFITRIFNPEEGPLTFDEARRFQSMAGKKLALDLNSQPIKDKALLRAIGNWYGELSDAVEQTASQGQLLSKFKDAMTEYRRAMGLADVGAKAKTAAKVIAAGTAATAAARVVAPSVVGSLRGMLGY
jgi:hypothetical protein